MFAYIADVLLVDNDENAKFLFHRWSFRLKETRYNQSYHRHVFLQEMKTRINYCVKKGQKRKK